MLSKKCFMNFGDPRILEGIVLDAEMEYRIRVEKIAKTLRSLEIW